MTAEAMHTPNDDRERARLIDLERALLDPAVRHDRGKVAALLAEDFEEFGSSGRVWTRAGILDALAAEPEQSVEASDFRCTFLSPTVALVTYRTVRTHLVTGAQTRALRSSLWVTHAAAGGESGGWRVRFHQGTIVP